MDLGFPNFGVLDIWWVETPKRHTFWVYAFHRYCFLYRLCLQDTGRLPFLALAPPTLETSRIFNRYPHIYGFAVEIVDIRSI